MDSSLGMASALAQKGHGVYSCSIGGISWLRGAPVAHAQVKELEFGSSSSEVQETHPRQASLSEFQVIHMRKDPPFDVDYVASTWFLESAEERGSVVLNSPAALRRFNEKLAILRYPQDCHPTLISADVGELLEFFDKETSGNAVLKPLTLYGGRGVIHLESKDAKTRSVVESTLRAETASGKQHRLMQPFDTRVKDGEVRCFTVGGKAIAWCLKKPASGHFLANTRAGATLHSYTPTTTDIERVTRIAQDLLQMGVHIIGFDLLGGMVSEINITSPRMLRAPGDTTSYYEQMADYFINLV